MAGRFRDLYYMVNKNLFSVLPDPLYHNLLGWIMHKRAGAKFHRMNLKSPKTFNEKLQILKNKGDLALKTQLADKFEVRKWVESKLGNKYLVPLIPLNKEGELCIESIDSIDWEFLPDNFVLKSTKGSGYNLICKDKSKLDKKTIEKRLSDWLKIKNYYFSREPYYKGKNRIICETLLKYNINDYKFFCFDGKPEFLKVDVGRFEDHHANYYSTEWQLLDISEKLYAPDTELKLEKPEKFDEMLRIAATLSKGFPFVRVDLYESGHQVYFGEITFCPTGGYAPLEPYEWSLKIGDMINL